ncbi:MAG TPA: hypothetical protein VI386_22660 [Candidatus Sulfotelmatobacter sp.]
MNKMFQYLSGRHTAFAAFFAATGTVMQCYHKLDLNYVALIGAVQTFVFAHSAKEDYFENKSKGEDVPPKAPDVS